MRFVPHLYDSENLRVSVQIDAMSQEDAWRTTKEPLWQTDWTSSYLQSGRFDCFAVKRGDELIALGAYEIKKTFWLFTLFTWKPVPKATRPSL